MTQPKSGRRPRTGEKRRTKLPLKIDKLIAAQPVVAEAILHLKNVAGRTWMEIEEQSSREYSAKWMTDLGGFVDWHQLPLAILDLFPDLKLPHTNLHRWHDLRVDQVMQETMARSAAARELATAFKGSTVKGDDEAVINAARDTIMALIAERGDEASRIVATKQLLSLAQVQQQAKLNVIRDRKVGTDERKIKILEDREAKQRAKLEAETERAARKVADGRFGIEDINRIRERVFGMPPLEAVSSGD